ncbi:hypothetical protein COOONC_13543 [Cooperia oncophora]
MIELVLFGVFVLVTQAILLCGRKKAGAEAGAESAEPASEKSATDADEKGKTERVLDKSKLNPFINNMQIAVRDPIINRAMQLELEMQEKQTTDKPFRNIIRANIGDSEAMEHSSMTFNRQVGLTEETLQEEK